jgi:hypothetical protein
LLGDVVLVGAALDARSGVSTGYVERARSAADGEALQHVFVNASRVDWQVPQDHAGAPRLADALWNEVESEFKSGGIRARIALVGLLQKVAYYQPDRALRLVRWTIDNPTDVVEDIEGVVANLYTPTYEQVLRELPAVLKVIAYNFDYFAEAVDTLWRLAQPDERPTPQNPDHAIRMLQDLAAYEPGKPLIYNEAFVDAAERWLMAASGEEAHSPFDVLEQLLATEGFDDSYDGRAISFRPFAVNAESTAPLRERVIELALREARHPDVRRAARAIAAVERGLRYPTGLFGRPVPDAESAKWTPGFVELLASLGSLVATPELDPVVGVAIRKAVNWHAEYSDSETRGPARQVVERIPNSVQFELALFIHDGWGHLMTGQWTDYEKMQQEQQARVDDVALRVLAEYDDDGLAAVLSERLLAERRAFGPTAGHPGPFCWTLFSKRPSFAVAVCERLVVAPESVLSQVLAIAVARVADDSPDALMTMLDDLLSTGALTIRREVAQALGWHRGGRHFASGERDLLLQFAVDEDPYVRNNVVRAAQLLSTSSKGDALELVSAVRFGDSPLVAEEVCGSFGPHGFLEWNELSSDQQQAMLAQLVECPSIEDYHLTSFLAQVSVGAAATVVALLRTRIERSEEMGSAHYRALPFHWDTGLDIKGQAQTGAVLRQVRDWIARKPDSWQRREFGGDLFAAIAQDFDDSVLAVLEESMYSGDRAQFSALAAILKKVRRSLLWDNPDFVARLLAAASLHGEGVVQEVGGALHSAAISGLRQGTPGQPYPEDVELRDRAAAIASKLPSGSLEERFYRSLQESAERNIDWSRERDELSEDRRDW